MSAVHDGTPSRRVLAEIGPGQLEESDFRRSVDRRCGALAAGDEGGIPFADEARMAPERMRELERLGVWIGRRARITPVEQVQALARIPAGGRRAQVGLGEPVR